MDTISNSLTRNLSKPLLIGAFFLLMQSMPLCAKTLSISTRITPPVTDPGASISNASLLGGAYFMVLLVIGYVLKWYFDLRKSKNENADINN